MLPSFVVGSTWASVLNGDWDLNDLVVPNKMNSVPPLSIMYNLLEMFSQWGWGKNYYQNGRDWVELLPCGPLDMTVCTFITVYLYWLHSSETYMYMLKVHVTPQLAGTFITGSSVQKSHLISLLITVYPSALVFHWKRCMVRFLCDCYS